jgi:hypothetical protein
VRIILNKSNFLKSLGINIENEENEDNEDTNGYFEEDEDTGRKKYVENKNSKSKNFEAIKNYDIMFKHVGGYDNIKQELNQCIDILKNYENFLNCPLLYIPSSSKKQTKTKHIYFRFTFFA